MLKSVFLGCGPRAMAHARAYEFVQNGCPVAACDHHEEKLNVFCHEFGIDRKYTDIHEMLEKEKPDLIHIVTAPSLRNKLMKIISDHRVPVALV